MGDSPKKQINLLRGWPNPSLLPTPQIQAAANTALSNSAVSIPGLLYGPDPGYQPLRQSIARWLDNFYRHSTSSLDDGGPDAERICITGGASQNLACVLQVFTDPVFTKVFMVAPCYFLACRIFEDAGLKTRAISEGEKGVDLESLEKALIEREKEVISKKLKQPKPWSKIYRNIIYCVPTFSNPSGKSMVLSHRIELVKLARKYDALIITDDVYDFLQWPTSSSNPKSLNNAQLPRLVDIDRTLDPVPNSDSFGNAVSNGSFSKIVGPGVRTGWAESTRKFTYGLSQCGSSRSGGAPSQMTATVINELLTSSALETQIESVLKPAYQKRYHLMMEAIKRELVPLSVTVTEDTLREKDEVFGGYFIWIELHNQVNAELVASKAKSEENLIVAPGKLFEVQGDDSLKFPNALRLCFAWEAEEDLDEGVSRLALVVKREMEVKSRQHGAKVDEQDFGEFS